jgi:hypothetical protein
MTCCACETTGIAGPLVRYLPPQKLSPTLLTHSLAAVRAMPNPATSLRTRNCPRYGGIGDDHPTEYNCTLLERHHDDGPLRLTASREATLPQYPALGARESVRRGISANVQQTLDRIWGEQRQQQHRAQSSINQDSKRQVPVLRKK